MSHPSTAPTDILPYQSLDIPALLHYRIQEGRSGYLVIDDGNVTWFIYFNQGSLVYITHSADPIDRVDSQLRALSHQVPELTPEMRSLVRNIIQLNQDRHPRSDYQAICELVHRSIINVSQALELINILSLHALEFLLNVREGTCSFWVTDLTLPFSAPLNFETLLNEIEHRLNIWHQYNPLVWSPYQRPYLIAHSTSLQRLPIEQQQSLAKILRGFSFRHLSILMKQDELFLIQRLFPLIKDKTILLREPQSPFDQLPRLTKSAKSCEESIVDTSIANITPIEQEGLSLFESAGVSEKHFKIACIDDSPAMLQTIERFLGKENLTLSVINDSVIALIEVMRFKPDLVLMDVGMPKVDGYELCKLIRRHSQFKATPIIMVTGNTGLIDRAKAKLSGATDYMTKPFTQDELLKMVFRYLE